MKNIFENLSKLLELVFDNQERDDIFITCKRQPRATSDESEIDKMNAVAILNTVSKGWTESRVGGLLCNPNVGGGIIDFAIASKEWFIIFNDDRQPIEGFESREDAVEAFAAASAAQ